MIRQKVLFLHFSGALIYHSLRQVFHFQDGLIAASLEFNLLLLEYFQDLVSAVNFLNQQSRFFTANCSTFEGGRYI
jgi:hypothetical protein